MVSETRRAEIRIFYRTRRLVVNKTQVEVEWLARMEVGRYWKIENGYRFPSEEERRTLARILKVNDADVPSEQAEAKAS